MWFTRVSINHPVFATMMMVAFVVLGLFSYKRLPVEQFPDVAFPVVVVQTEYPGASPEVVESEVTRRLEEQVNTISGVYELSSRSYEGVSLVIVRFDLAVDPVVAAQDVREKIALVRPALRREVKESLVTRVNPDDDPVVSVAVRSPQRGPRELTTLTEQVIKRRLENVRGVGRVTVVGGVRREIQIALRFKLAFVDAGATAPLNLGNDQRGLRLDKETRQAWVNGLLIDPPLSLHQYRLLDALWESGGSVLTRDQIVNAVWPEAAGDGVSEQAIDALVRRLRERIEECDNEFRYIITVRGHGFRLENR